MKKLLDEINETQEIVRTLNWEVLIKKKKDIQFECPPLSSLLILHE